MRGLTRAETTAYFEHQLRHAGCKRLVFEPAAIGKANNVTTEHVQAALIELG